MSRLARFVPKRLPATALGVFGSLGVWAFQPDDVIKAFSLSALAGFLLSFALRGRSRRMVGGLVALLGIGMLIVAWGDVRLVLASFIVAACGLVIVLVSPTWEQKAPSYERKISGDATPRDLWLRMDTGDDPTADENR